MEWSSIKFNNLDCGTSTTFILGQSQSRMGTHKNTYTHTHTYIQPYTGIDNVFSPQNKNNRIELELETISWFNPYICSQTDCYPCQSHRFVLLFAILSLTKHRDNVMCMSYIQLNANGHLRSRYIHLLFAMLCTDTHKKRREY